MNSFASIQVQAVVLCGCFILLFIPSPYIRSFVILAIGMLLYAHEKRLKLWVPASPGVMFWLGNVFSYIIGGMGYALLQDRWDGFGIRYLNHALFYLGIGFSFYLIGVWVASLLVSRRTPLPPSHEFEIRDKYLPVFLMLFVLPVFLGGDYESGSVYHNLVIGAIQSVERLPIILLAVTMFTKRPKWWLVILLFAASFSVAIKGMVIGYGRSKVLYAVLSLIMVWFALHFREKVSVSKHTKLIMLLLPVMLISYFGVATAYRTSVAFDQTLSVEERQQIAFDSVGTFSNDNFFVSSLTDLTHRLAQTNGLELIGKAESPAFEKYGWTSNDLNNVLLMHVPKVIYKEKNKGLGRDIMEYYGFTVFNNIPPTLLGDSFRRSGVFGVIVVYFLMGLTATFFAMTLNKRLGSFGRLLALYLGISSITLVSIDAIVLTQFYFYRIVSSGAVIYVLVYMTGIMRGSKSIRWLQY